MNQINNDYQAFIQSNNHVAQEFYYAAFTTLLLIFENSIIACSSALNGTDALYKVAQAPIQVTMPAKA